MSNYDWEAWVGEVITQMYTDPDTNLTTIVVETGRGAKFITTGDFFVTEPYRKAKPPC